MLIPSASNVEVTPAMLGILWGIAHELDRTHVPQNLEDAVWLEIPSKRLRNPDGKSDNQWLRVVLDRLMGLKLGGEYRGNPWGAVVLAEWEIKERGALTRLLIPPAAVQAIRAPQTFAKIEITAAYKLTGHARRLYAALADKKRMQQSYWEYSLEELQSPAVFDLNGKYSKWYDFSRYVLTPVLSEINDFGTVQVKATPRKVGRSVRSVRFDWEWKSLDAARVTDEENSKHSSARHKVSDGTAPPLTDEEARKAKAARDQDEFKRWQETNAGGYSDFLTWKKSKPLISET